MLVSQWVSACKEISAKLGATCETSIYLPVKTLQGRSSLSLEGHQCFDDIQ